MNPQSSPFPPRPVDPARLPCSQPASAWLGPAQTTVGPTGLPELPTLLRHTARLIRHHGVWRTLLACAALSSALSLLFTAVWLRLQGHAQLGSALWISLVVPLPLSLGFGGWMLHLVAALDQAHEQVRHLAMTDPLTGLANRRQFILASQQHLHQARHSGQALSLALLDLDHFKAVNDQHGHDAGDLVLQTTAQRLHANLQQGELLARWGGEEFALLLPGQAANQAAHRVDALRRQLAQAVALGPQGPSLWVSASIGLVSLEPQPTGDAEGEPHRPHSLDQLLRLADDALYAAKHAGRDMVRAVQCR